MKTLFIISFYAFAISFLLITIIIMLNFVKLKISSKVTKIIVYIGIVAFCSFSLIGNIKPEFQKNTVEILNLPSDQSDKRQEAKKEKKEKKSALKEKASSKISGVKEKIAVWKLEDDLMLNEFTVVQQLFCSLTTDTTESDFLNMLGNLEYDKEDECEFGLGVKGCEYVISDGMDKVVANFDMDGTLLYATYDDYEHPYAEGWFYNALIVDLTDSQDSEVQDAYKGFYHFMIGKNLVHKGVDGYDYYKYASGEEVVSAVINEKTY